MPLTSWNHYILVVEDYADLRDLYRSTLRAAGYAVIGVEDGLDALRLVATQIPEAVVLDLSLPRLGGREVVKALKASRDTPGIPVEQPRARRTPKARVGRTEQKVRRVNRQRQR